MSNKFSAGDSENVEDEEVRGEESEDVGSEEFHEEDEEEDEEEEEEVSSFHRFKVLSNSVC